MQDLKIEEKSILEAAKIYLLMKKGFPISRNVRAQWILDHLDTIVTIQKNRSDDTPELEIVSIIPKSYPLSWADENYYQYQYRVSTSTSVVFLAHKYRMVFCLDLSPSLGTIDIQYGEIVMDEVCMATRRCLENISKPFIIPGSIRILQPEIYVTIIVHTPFLTNPAQQVLVHGWLITSDNISCLMQFMEKKLNSLEERIVQVTSTTHQHQENFRVEIDGLVSRLFDEKSSIGAFSTCASNEFVSVISPDASFINILRYGQLALSLLPANSCAHLVIVSDGIVGITDVYALDSVIQQFRAATVACSFIQMGSAYHPHCANGLVPYQDVLCFLATATLGCHIALVPQLEETFGSQINIYQDRFLCWKLYRPETCAIAHQSNYWHTNNMLFHPYQQPQLLRKKQLDDKVMCTLSSLMCCRLRDGYLMKKITLKDGCAEICFILPWKTHVFIEYLVTSAWPPKSSASCNKIQYTITVEAPYEFLHDITCLSKKPLKSQYRRSVISRFWITLTNLTESNNMLEHFSWLPEPGWMWYNVPDTVKNGIPVFNLPAYPSATTLQLNDASCPQFGKIWQPVASLNPNQWGRWMHSQRITLVLTHDRPLSKYLHQANQSGRFQSVQCRQAAAVLYAMLENWATFVLVENHTYVQFIYRDTEKPPVSFSVIKINCKALCVVLNIAFAGGTKGIVRHNVLLDLIHRLSTLVLPNRPTEQRETPCCTIIHKALEKILIRYERMPIKLSTVILPDGTQHVPLKTDLISVGIPTTTLCRYLNHNRWLWIVKKPVIRTIPGIVIPRLNNTAVARILSTITKIRLKEGFNFAYSSAGIINMLLEIQMQGSHNDCHPCVIQYIIFPPHTISNTILDGETESEENTDGGTGDGDEYNEDNERHEDYQIVTEMWIEPQCGRVKLSEHPAVSYMNLLSYCQLSTAIAQIDEECINTLLTLEYLSLLTQTESHDTNIDIVNGYQEDAQSDLSNYNLHKPLRRISVPNFAQSRIFFDDSPDERINSKFFTFDTLNILPKCRQAELLYSMFNDSVNNENNESANSILIELLMNQMKRLHNTELVMSTFDCEKFTEMLFNRPRDNCGSPLSSSHLHGSQRNDIRWRCFIKGINVTHVVITFIPATERDVKALIHSKVESQKCSHNGSIKNHDLINDTIKSTLPETIEEEIPPLRINNFKINSSLNQHMHDFKSNLPYRKIIPENMSKSEKRRHVQLNDTKPKLILPIYVYDCSLSMLIDVLVDKQNSPRLKDIYQNNVFTVGQHNVEEFIKPEVPEDCKLASPELKNEESDNLINDQQSLMKHCKVLSLVHCHCYVVAVYKSLSLQLQMSHEDIEAAVEQCEESLIEINITNYLQKVCNHLNNSIDSISDQSCTCLKFQPLHNLIKEKFRKIITLAFKPVPSHAEFYYFSPSQNLKHLNSKESDRSDSDDDLEEFIFHSESHDYKLDNPTGKINVDFNATWPNTKIKIHDDRNICNYASSESFSDFQEDDRNNKEQPLFLQLNCSVYSGSCFSSIPVKLLPTCFTEMKHQLDDYEESDIKNVKITLDIICLNLPKEVLDVNLEQNPDLEINSYYSTLSIDSVDTNSENSRPNNNILSDNGLINERLSHLPLYQHYAITNLKTEIEWLLKDEIATALLNTHPPSYEILNYVAHHVADSNGRTTCQFDKVPLHFVFPSTHSGPKFFQELIKMETDRYAICQQDEFLYFVKNNKIDHDIDTDKNIKKKKSKKDNNEKSLIKTIPDHYDKTDDGQDLNCRTSGQDPNEYPGCHSEISSIGDGYPGTDDGYEGDSSNSEDDYCWLTDLDKQRGFLPNFWLILQVQHDYVDVYFHCRFLDFVSPEVDRYRFVQKFVVSQIAAICRRVNQYLLLESLHDTRNCDPLLEPESCEEHGWRAETNIETGPVTVQDSTIKMTPGIFKCSVVWEETFCLHPRLKTGPGRSGLSRGIKALHVVLNRFSVNNRDNMFVYRENNSNVFYLRLHEQTSDGKSLQNKLSESDERLMVSRSNSVTSLSHSRMSGHQMDPIKIDDTRPRVRSFGEKDSKSTAKSDDSIVLMVHGISEPGLEVRSELVQVLHNRLDDAVLEVLSVMLARNPMCKLTPADVHFIQKPYRQPESYVQFSVQYCYLKHIDALAYYLRQNVLQFLYIPKYTDSRAHYHLQDYSQPESSKERVSETDIFLNNQSQSSGNRGIACIAMAVNKEYRSPCKHDFPTSLRISDFSKVISTSVCEKKVRTTMMSHGPIEFRIWKQGRVNLETLIEKLRAAINHATWDLVTEYYLLRAPLTISLRYNVGNECISETKLHDVYHKTLPYWFKFALDIGVSSVKKHIVTIQHRHPISTSVKELQNLIRLNAPDTSAQAFILRQRQPFLFEDDISSEFLLPFRSTEISLIDEKVEDKCHVVDTSHQITYIPHEFSFDYQQSHSKAVIVARNFNQWKASFNPIPDPELLIPKDQKLLQKFNPLIQESSFIPRQRLLLAEVQGDQFVLYLYNWSKERSEKLIKQVMNLGTWLSFRSTLFSKITMHKLGIFHHQLLESYLMRDDHAHQYCQLTDIDTLSKFSVTLSNDGNKDWSRSVGNRSVGKNIHYPWDRILGQVMRDAKPNMSYPLNITDPIIKAVYDLQDLHQRERRSKENLTRLYTMWQSRSAAPNIPISTINLDTFKQYSRLIHYCYTPILFLSDWRLQSAATRDHSLAPPSSISSINTHEQTLNDNQRYEESKIDNKNGANAWHQELCMSMMSEYKQYLQLLGFNPLQIDAENKNDSDERPPQLLCYLKKSMLGGILLFELHMIQPFFTAKLRAIECNRLQTKSNTTLVNQFMLSFVDACEKIKINMHLHSFTYDFHLRCIYSYITGTGYWSMQRGYHLTHFLEDFIKYYSKAPNFARNLVDSDIVTVKNLTTPAPTLFSYLLSHERTYGMQVFDMTSNIPNISESEYVLVRLQNTPPGGYSNVQDTKFTDDFTVALIVSKQDQPPQLEKSEITLKYYLLLTSKRELYPKREVENYKLGKFRTVYNVVKTANGSNPESLLESSPSVTPTSLSDKSSKDEICNDFEFLETNAATLARFYKRNSVMIEDEKSNNVLAPIPPPVPSSPLITTLHTMKTSKVTSPDLIQIRQESINYLGYYSSHEQSMQELIISQARAAQQHITNMIECGMLHCRTHLLWNKLLETKSTMTYGEFMELRSLANVELLSSLDSRLNPLINQPISWYQTLAKVLQNKYQEYYKQFGASEGNVIHHLILHPSYLQAFMMLTVDVHASRGELYAVYQKSAEFTSSGFGVNEIHCLIEGFINACCFHLWMGLYNQ